MTEDLTIFFDLAGFASTHTLDGVSKTVVVGDKTSGRSELDGAYVTMFDVFVKKTDLSVSPVRRQKMSFDGVSHSIEQVKDDGAVYTITMTTARVGEQIG